MEGSGTGAQKHRQTEHIQILSLCKFAFVYFKMAMKNVEIQIQIQNQITLFYIKLQINNTSPRLIFDEKLNYMVYTLHKHYIFFENVGWNKILDSLRS